MTLALECIQILMYVDEKNAILLVERVWLSATRHYMNPYDYVITIYMNKMAREERLQREVIKF